MAMLAAAAAIAVCLWARAANADCTIPPTRALPAGGMSEPGGLYPGEVFAVYGDTATYCKANGTIPLGQQCEVQCKQGYADVDGTDYNHVACIDGELDWTKLPKCESAARTPIRTSSPAARANCARQPLHRYIGATGHQQCSKCCPGTRGERGTVS